jgi:hypothetical protein
MPLRSALSTVQADDDDHEVARLRDFRKYVDAGGARAG